MKNQVESIKLNRIGVVTIVQVIDIELALQKNAMVSDLEQYCDWAIVIDGEHHRTYEEYSAAKAFFDGMEEAVARRSGKTTKKGNGKGSRKPRKPREPKTKEGVVVAPEDRGGIVTGASS